MGGISQFCYLICLLYSTLALSIIIIFNKSNANHYQWLNIVYALKRQQSMTSIGMNDINVIEEFVNKVNFIRYILLNLMFIFFCSVVLMTLTVVIINYDFMEIIF